MTPDLLPAWLDQRRPTPPPALRARLHAALDDRESPSAGRLADLGGELLARVAKAPVQDRRHALDLLAADALITYAFEAQAEADVAGLAALAERVVRDQAP